MSGRCKACDKKMNEFEMTRKFVGSGTYVDLCNHCFSYIKGEVDVVERPDLKEYEDWEEDDETYQDGEMS